MVDKPFTTRPSPPAVTTRWATSSRGPARRRGLGITLSEMAVLDRSAGPDTRPLDGAPVMAAAVVHDQPGVAQPGCAPTVSRTSLAEVLPDSRAQWAQQ